MLLTATAFPSACTAYCPVHAFQRIPRSLNHHMVCSHADDTPDDQASSAPGTPSAAPVTISTINLVDLAGSERLPATTSDTPEQEKLRQKEVRPAQLIGARWRCMPQCTVYILAAARTCLAH